ncbi:helix-turn-helix domain-containing protein [Perlucidibaca piscinae]|uniref:helix-turn-helix domain-containing protein n=1 Tax=Perlucidibaca piscinae TaxID=392589 RepID=UPI0003B483D8|nr:helix-turn-helix transcriptional regulator [Perlucidibaca piscinae]
MGFGDRLREERSRLNRTQAEFASLGGCSKNTQLNYEKEERTPDLAYLAGIGEAGADVLYIVMGVRNTSMLEQFEEKLLTLYRSAPVSLQAAALGALEAGLSADRGVLIKGAVSGQVAGGDITNSGPVRFGK